MGRSAPDRKSKKGTKDKKKGNVNCK